MTIKVRCEMPYITEPPQDPSLKYPDALDRPSIAQQEASDLEREKPFDKKGKKTEPTGEHPPVCSTGTDGEGMETVTDGEEENAQSIQRQEPDDPLPDQLDRNR
jgi:hypothetical protein